MAKLVFGCGYLGERVARQWRKAGHDVYAVTRREARARELAELGICPVIGDVTESIRLPRITSLETVLFAVARDRLADKTLREVYVQGLQNALRALPDSLPRFLYISSTGVYGQRAGEWVDEDAPCEPCREGGIACLAAERLLASDRLGSRATVLRLGGLYGPGRIPQLPALRAGKTLAVAGSGYLNLLHIDDAVRIVLAAEQHAQPPCCYVVADGHPVQRRDFYCEAARLLGLAAPRFEEPAAGSSAAARAASSKRLVTARMQRDLLSDLLYPSYREGLRSIVSEQGAGHS
jgi:nucleoside-diphosphate-sugar epimerase